MLIEGKSNALDSLHRLLTQGLLPVGPDDQTTLRNDYAKPSSGDDHSKVLWRRDGEQRWELKERLSSGALNTAVPWDGNTYTSVQHYLATRSPKEALVALAAIAEELRGAIEKNFTLADILIDVGDPRLSDGAEDILW
jgi:hypothetical protein